MSTSARVMAKVEANNSTENIEAKAYAHFFRMRSERAYDDAIQRISEMCIQSVIHPEITHYRASRYAAWLRDRLHDLSELPGCEELNGDPALDMVSDYLWWMESQIKAHYESAPPSKT